jgi:aspartate-semialdehyde dehydrogenase
MKRYKVGIIGATGMVGQRFALLLAEHPWFEVTTLAASSRSAGKPYAESVGGRWAMPSPMPVNLAGIPVLDAEADLEKIAGSVDFVFCAVDMPKTETLALEERYARAECPVVSNNSASRAVPDVPMLIPEVNPGHMDVIPSQRKRLGTKRGFIAVKSNCSVQSYVPALHPLRDFGIEKVSLCTYQAISGAGKTFETMPEIVDNVIPYIGGDEEGKSEREPLKIWGEVKNSVIVSAAAPVISAQCVRVPVSDGHLAAVSFSLQKKVEADEILRRWREYKVPEAAAGLPSSPEKFLTYFAEIDRPQTKLERGLHNGMGIALGRLRPDTVFDYRFIGLSHNTLRGAAGGAVLVAEMLCKGGYIT